MMQEELIHASYQISENQNNIRHVTRKAGLKKFQLASSFMLAVDSVSFSDRKCVCILAMLWDFAGQWV